uniref:Uncharacterized protein n=1 Tax=Salmo trutta TaxID=8032 RepID=A0A674EQR7_SALTR
MTLTLPKQHGVRLTYLRWDNDSVKCLLSVSQWTKHWQATWSMPNITPQFWQATWSMPNITPQFWQATRAMLNNTPQFWQATRSMPNNTSQFWQATLSMPNNTPQLCLTFVIILSVF